jgi:DNA-binding NarL/FixJ family response regulator
MHASGSSHRRRVARSRHCAREQGGARSRRDRVVPPSGATRSRDRCFAPLDRRLSPVSGPRRLGYGDPVPVHLQLAQAPADPTPGAPGARAIRVVVADDHAQMRRSLRMLLDREDGVKVIAEAGDLPTVMRHVQGHRPHVLVIDLRMPNGSSIDAIRSLREQVPSTEIVVVTMEDSPAFAQQALDADAIGFVLKDTADAELPEAVRRAARRERYISPRVGGRFATGRRVAGAARARQTLRRGLGGS